MKGLIEVRITEKENVWRKTIRFLGMPIYWRRDLCLESKRNQLGFNSYSPVSGEIEDDDM